MSDVAIRSTATTAVPDDYKLPGAQEIIPKSVTANMDGSATTAAWFPCLQVLDPAGHVMLSAVSQVAVAAGVSADVSWFPHVDQDIPTGAATTGTILEQFLVDSQASGGTTSSTVLASGVSYLVTVQGTYSLWNSTLEKGTPNADAIFPSSLAGRVSTQVGLDAECAFAYHDEGTGFTLGHKNLWTVNLGSGFLHVEPQGGPFATPQPNYLYRYTLVGQGSTVTFKVNDLGAFADNYGKLQVTIYGLSGSGTGGGGGSLVPPDGSDHSILRVESGVPGWEARPNIVEADFSFTDVTTANASTSQHGLLPKLPGGTTTFLRGDGTYVAPGGSGTVTNVSSANTGIAVANPTTTPVLTLATLDVIAADGPAAANWSNNSHKITSLTAGAAAGEAAIWDQVDAGIVTTKGDLVAATGSHAVARLAVGSNNQVLVADSTQSTGIKWAAAPAGSGGALTLIGSVVLGGDAANMDVSSIPATFNNLLVVIQHRSTAAVALDSSILRFNADTGANYNYQFTNSHGSTVGGFNGSGVTGIQIQSVGASGTASGFSVTQFVLPRYADTVNLKAITGTSSCFSTSLASGNVQAQNITGYWNSAAAITELTFVPTTGPNFKAGSSMQVYGMS